MNPCPSRFFWSAIALLGLASADVLRASTAATPAAATVSLSTALNVRDAESELARPVLNKSANNERLTIAGRAFEHGVGVQSECTIALAVNGATRFTALAGVDDATTNADDGVIFSVIADGELLWRSEAMHKTMPPVAIDVSLREKKELRLVVEDAGHSWTRAYADWADAQFECDDTANAAPKSFVVPPVEEPAIVLTPAPGPEPRINSARVFGVRPGHPFLYTIAATGERPMHFSADGLPQGLTLDAATGRITGVIASNAANAPSTHVVTLRAKNARGAAEQKLRIEVGETIALTPPMGWNSWNCWGPAVDQDKVMRSARAMVASSLVNHGWTYINIDDAWQAPRGGPHHALQGNEKFPDLHALCDAIHAMGLKAGIYSTPWTTSYAVYPGGSAETPDAVWTKPTGPKTVNRNILPWAIGKISFATNDATQWAEWGIDYLKYDWNPNEPPETEEMMKALRASGRDIVLSLSNNAPLRNATALSALANSWRTTGDIRDYWGSVLRIGFSQDKWRPFSRPGHWNDPDMLVVGKVGWGPRLHDSNLTPNEQYLHITLWSLLASPLLIGCDLEQLDAFTLNLLTNDDVLAVSQDPLGKQAAQIVNDGRRQVWARPLEDGSWAIGLFNLSQRPDVVTIAWAQLDLKGPQRVRDLWPQKDLGTMAEGFTAEIPRHGARMIRVWAVGN